MESNYEKIQVLYTNGHIDIRTKEDANLLLDLDCENVIMYSRDKMIEIATNSVVSRSEINEFSYYVGYIRGKRRETMILQDGNIVQVFPGLVYEVKTEEELFQDSVTHNHYPEVHRLQQHLPQLIETFL